MLHMDLMTNVQRVSNTAARFSCVAPTNNKARHGSRENSGHTHDSSITVAGFN
jgi:hypothetical protein